MKTAFLPIAHVDSKILILGTMPSERSLKLQQYYGHAGNQFWKIMFIVLGKPFSTDYSTRKNLLLKHRVALWDVLNHCEGKGSSDTAIKNEMPNDFSSFYQSHSKIRHVFFGSKKAEVYYDKYIGKTPERNYYLLSSPSPLLGVGCSIK